MQLCTNRFTHAPVRKTLHSRCLFNSSSNSSIWSVVVVMATTSRVIFAFALLSVEGLAMISGGHSSGFSNQFGPFHHNSAFVTLPPLLPRSAGFSVVGTWCQVISWWAWILWIRLAMNCLYSPWSWIQCSGTLLSNQQYKSVTGNPASAFLTLQMRLVAMYMLIWARAVEWLYFAWPDVPLLLQVLG